jgi:hypothetical protein
MPGQFERWFLRLRLQGRVLPQCELDGLDAVFITAFADELGVFVAHLAQQFEDPIVHRPHQEGDVRPLALSHPRRLPRLRGLGVRLPQCHEFPPRPLDNPLKIGQKLAVDWVIAHLEGLDRLLSAGDEDREQGHLLLVGPRLHRLTLPRAFFVKTSLGFGSVTQKPLREFESNRGSIEIWEREGKVQVSWHPWNETDPDSPHTFTRGDTDLPSDYPDTDNPDALLAWGKSRWGTR